MEKIKKIYITFDIDCSNYMNKGKTVDEFPFANSEIFPILIKNNTKATWFIRLDKNIEENYGEPDYLFSRYSNIIENFKKHGHAIAWHPHFYKNGKQNCNEKEILEEMDYLKPFLDKYNLSISRIGWGFMTNKIMEKLGKMGIKKDSTAIPRPNYKFDKSIRDWVITSQLPYFPSRMDYRRERISEESKYDLIEYPITTFKIIAPYDTEEVIRYCNLSFKNKFIFNGIIKLLDEQDYFLSITHPYELMKCGEHQLMSFNICELEKNINFIKHLDYNVSSEVL